MAEIANFNKRIIIDKYSIHTLHIWIYLHTDQKACTISSLLLRLNHSHYLNNLPSRHLLLNNAVYYKDIVTKKRGCGRVGVVSGPGNFSWEVGNYTFVIIYSFFGVYLTCSILGMYHHTLSLLCTFLTTWQAPNLTVSCIITISFHIYEFRSF